MLTTMPTDVLETYLCAFCISDTPYEDAWLKVRSLTVEPGVHLVIAEIPVFKAPNVEGPRTREERAERMLALAERYHQTNLDVMRNGICLPIRLGFVIGAEDSAIAAVRSLAPQLWNLFEQARGREEWSVKVTVPKKDFDLMTRAERETPDSAGVSRRKPNSGIVTPISWKSPIRRMRFARMSPRWHCVSNAPPSPPTRFPFSPEPISWRRNAPET